MLAEITDYATRLIALLLISNYTANHAMAYANYKEA